MKRIVNQKCEKHTVAYGKHIIFKFSFRKLALLIPFLRVIVGIKAKQKSLVSVTHRGVKGMLSYEMVSPQTNDLIPLDTGVISTYFFEMFYFSKSHLSITKRMKTLKT